MSILSNCVARVPSTVELRKLMKGNIPIPELPFAEEVWLMVAVTSVRERRTQQGKLLVTPQHARNATGSLPRGRSAWAVKT